MWFWFSVRLALVVSRLWVVRLSFVWRWCSVEGAFGLLIWYGDGLRCTSAGVV